mgnify:CR=1 FL=1
MPMIKSPTAWMLRQDGEAFPVIQHLYGSLECVEETLYVGEWLYKHTSIPTTQQLVLKLVAAYGKSLHPKEMWWITCGKLSRRSLHLSHPRLCGENGFPAADGGAVFPGTIEPSGDRETQPGISPLPPGRAVQHHTGCRDMYFRVSNPAFDWEPAIRRFLETHRDEMETVTVVWDEESTGRKGFFFHPSGTPMNRIPWKGDATYGETP